MSMKPTKLTGPTGPLKAVAGAALADTSANPSVRVLLSNGSVLTWGNNTNTQLGDNSQSNRSVPVAVAGPNTWGALAATYERFPGGILLDPLSYAWAWGTNSNGANGDNTANSQSSPISVVGGRQWRTILATVQGVFGLDSLSYAWGWGTNGSGQLGNGTSSPQSSPVSVQGGRQFTSLFSVTGSALALDSFSYAWCWGFGGQGNLGTNTTVSTSSPVSVVGGRRWRAITTCNLGSFLGLDLLSYAYAWGPNGTGQIGDNTANAASSPTSVVGGRQWRTILGASSASDNTVIALDSLSYAWAWGSNNSGQCGDNSTTNRSSPVSVVGGRQFTRLFHFGSTMVALDSLSYAWAWGAGTSGQLGDGTFVNSSSPVSVVGGIRWKNLFSSDGANGGNDVALAIDLDDVVWVWGGGRSGALAQQTNVSSFAVATGISLTGAPKKVFG
jgi:alpha-tubulin suppressor-like RCC1 family protein